MLLILIFISLLLMWLSLFDKVDRGILDRVLSSLGLLAWFRHAFLNIMLMCACGLSLQLALVSPGLGMVGFPGVLVEHDVYSCFVLALVSLFVCTCGVEPQLCADNLKCVSRDPDLHLSAARFTTGCQVGWPGACT